MDRTFWGDIFEVSLESGEDISTPEARHALLDKFCIEKELFPLGDKWITLPFEEAGQLLLDALRYDLAYTDCPRMPENQAKIIQQKIMASYADQTAYCYTNWFTSPWNEQIGGWNPLTEHTFDIGVVFIDSQKMWFVYLISED